MKLKSLVILLVIAGVLDAGEVVLQPEGLEPGDQFRLIFTTSQKRDATSSNIEDYNNFVQSVADSSPEVAAWGLEWKAIVSTPAVDAVTNTGTDWRVEIGVPIYRIDGVRVAVDNHDLWQTEVGDRNWTVLLDLDEGGRLLPLDAGFPAMVFTGTNSAGMASPIGHPPEDRGLGSIVAVIGTVNGRGPQTRYNLTTTRLEDVHYFYSLSDTVVAVPEPATHITALATIIGIISSSTRRRRRKSIEAVAFS